jgi:hypothetical protein
MGNLKPGATYIYERADGVTYAREFGATDRTVIGWDYDTKLKLDALEEDKLWGEIRRAAKTNKPLQDALERAIIIYQLSKDNGTK